VNIPLNHLTDRLGELPADRPILVYCAGGYRSSIAASLLERAGFADVADLAGGMAAWDAAELSKT
jgi:rhodanese-related sulfurtransferase